MFGVEKVLLISSIFLHISNSEDQKRFSVKKRIIGGAVCEDGKHPYIVFMEKSSGAIQCSGSLLHYTWVLTCSHCFDPEVTKVVIGKNTPGEQKRTIINTYAHPDITQDIGLIKTDSPVETSKYVSFVQLPTGKYSGEIGEFCPIGELMGWGSFLESGDVSTDLMCVELPIVSTKRCRDIVPSVIDTQVCTLTPESKGGCYGDAGSPLICKESGVVVGVFSAVSGDCGANCTPEIHVRVDRNLYFILRTMSYKSGSSQNCNNWNTIFVSCVLYFVTNKYI